MDQFERRDGFIVEIILVGAWIRADDGGGSHVLAFACDACAAPAWVFAFLDGVLAFDFCHIILLDLDYMQNMPGVKVFCCTQRSITV